MGNLGDALKKAGLISEQELARQRKGGRGRGKGRGPQGNGGRNQPGEERARRRAAALERLSDPEVAAAARRESRELLTSVARPLGRHGRRRFHYVDAQGRLPFLQVDEELGQGLERGELGIARAGDKVVVVPREAALRVEELFPGALLFLND